MAAILKTVKLQYLRNGLTDRHKIWQSDANCPGELHYPGRYTALTILRNKTAKKYITKLASVSLGCKSCRFKTPNIKIL